MVKRCLIVSVLVNIGLILIHTTAGATSFSPGDKVEVYNTLNVGLTVRESPAGNPIDRKYDGEVGMVLSGPIYRSLYNRSYTWWKLRWRDGTEGWSAEGYPGGVDYLGKKYISPSTKFSIGDKVEVYNSNVLGGLRVRTAPPELAKKGKVYDGTTGIIKDGPFYGVPKGSPGFYYFWKVKYDNGVVGWSVENGLKRAARKPDLTVVKIWTDPDPPVATGYTTIGIKIKNQGAGNATGTFFLELYFDNTHKGHVYINGLAAGATDISYWRAMTWPSDTNLHTIKGVVDPDNTVSESNESNNESSIQVRATPPPPRTGTLKVESSPSGAKVYIDGEYKGQTPSSGYLTISDLTAGDHSLKVIKSGYKEWTGTVTIPAGGTKFKAVILELSKPEPPRPISPGWTSEPGPVINTLTPTLRWEGVSNTDYYALGISEHPYGSSNLVYNPQKVYGTSRTVPSGSLEPDKKYRWNMQAHNNAGWSEVSRTLYFQTGEVSVRIDEYTPSSPIEVKLNEEVTISLSFTNRSDISWTFYAAATLRKPNGVEIDLPIKSVTLNPGQQGTASWSYPIDIEGNWDLVFGIWKESGKEISLGNTGWLNAYIEGTSPFLKYIDEFITSTKVQINEVLEESRLIGKRGNAFSREFKKDKHEQIASLFGAILGPLQFLRSELWWEPIEELYPNLATAENGEKGVEIALGVLSKWATYHVQKLDEERERIASNLPDLTSEEIGKYKQDLDKRKQANEAIIEALKWKATSLSEILEPEEGKLLEFLRDWGCEIVIGKLCFPFSGLFAIKDALDLWQQMDRNVQMMSFAYALLGNEAPNSIRLVADNVLAGIRIIEARKDLVFAEGKVGDAVDMTENQINIFHPPGSGNIMLSRGRKISYSNVTLYNTGVQKTRYHLIAKYGSGKTAWADMTVNSGEEKVIHIIYDNEEGPGEGLPVFLKVLGATNIGTDYESTYLVDEFNWIFTPGTVHEPFPCYIEITPQKGTVGTNFKIAGKKFTPNWGITLHFFRPDGTEFKTEKDVQITDPHGSFSYSFIITKDYPVGEITVYATDNYTGSRSNEVTYVVEIASEQPKFSKSDVVGVTETGKSGLCIRDTVGTSARILKVVPDGWAFRIIDGNPKYKDGHTWWKVKEERYETSPVEGWVAQDYLIKVPNPEDLVPPSAPNYFTSNQDKIERAIAWTIAQEGKIDWAKYCLKFVANAFGREAAGYHHPNEMKDALGDRFYSWTNCWNPPRGALVFFSGQGSGDDIDYKKCGHIGIYLDDGKVIHAYGIVRLQNIAGREEGIEGLSYIDSYIGWAYPPQEWIEITDTTKPTISFTFPSSGQTFTTPTITVEGTAWDNVGLSKVEVKVGAGDWEIASGLKSWSKQVTLSPGSNTISARATDTSGNTVETSVTIIYELPDSTPPAAVVDFTISEVTTNSITLTWTAPGDDGNVGAASEYDIRYLTSPITEANWNRAAQCEGEPKPKVAGSSESFTITGLYPDNTYCFAVRTADEVPNWSGLSNIATGTTKPAPGTTLKVTVQDDSMEPTLKAGQEVLVDKDYYQTHPLKRGDIVAIWFKTTTSKPIRRVIAIAGDKVEFQGSKIFINGKPLAEEYLKDPNYQIPETELKILRIPLERYGGVPQGSFIALSDNRQRAYDSRRWGCVPFDRILGKVIGYYSPTLVSIDLTVDPGTIAYNGYSSFKVMASYSDGSQKDVTSEASYKVVIGSEYGRIEDKGLRGTNNTFEDRKVTVEAGYGGKTDREEITIQGKPVQPTKKILSVPYYHQGDTEWCVPTSMAMIFKYYYGGEKNIHSWDIAKKWNWDREIQWWQFLEPRYGMIRDYFYDHGLKTAEKISDAQDFYKIKDWLDIHMPVILYMREPPHAVVIVGYSIDGNSKKVYINDPSGTFLKDELKLDLSPPYIAEPVLWDVVAQYAGGTSYAIAVGSPVDRMPPTLPKGTIDIAAAHNWGFYFSYKETPVPLVYSWLYGLDKGIGWKFEERSHSLVLTEKDLFIFDKYIANHTEVEQTYRLKIEFAKQGLPPSIVTTDSFSVKKHDRKGGVMDLTPLRNYIDESGEYTITLSLWNNDLTEKYDEIVFPPIKYISRPVISARISANITSYSPGTPIEIKVGKSATISVTFTNTGNTAWKFIAGATIWNSDGNQVANYSKTLSTALQPGQQKTVSWTHTVNQAGDYWLQFGVWKDSQTLLDKKPRPSQRLIIGIPSVISARIDEYSPSSPIQVSLGGVVTISFRFTNTGNVSYTFIAGASLWKPDGNIANFTKEVTLSPGAQGSASWRYTIDQKGGWNLQFAVWKGRPFTSENLLDKTSYLTDYIEGIVREDKASFIVADVIKNEAIGDPVQVTVDGQQYMIVTLKKYIDPETLERSEVAYTPIVYVDAQWNPVSDEETVKKIGLIGKARHLQEIMPDVIQDHRKAVNDRLKIHGLYKLADLIAEASEELLALAIRRHISGGAANLSKGKWIGERLTPELISAGKNVVWSLGSDPLMITLELSIYSDFMEAQDNFDYMLQVGNIDRWELAYDYIDHLLRGWMLGGALSAAWDIFDEIDQIGEPTYKKIAEQIADVLLGAATKILSLEELKNALDIIIRETPLVKEYCRKKSLAYNSYKSQLANWVDPDRLPAASRYSRALAKRFLEEPSRPDIAVPQVTFNPTSIRAGEDISITFTIENKGDVATGPFTCQIFITDNERISVPLGEHEVRETIDKNSTYSGSTTLHILSDITPGDYYIKVWADAFHFVDEADETNNIGRSSQILTITRPPKPDLTVTRVSAPSSAQAGATIPISFTVVNQGKVTSEAFTTRVFLAITPYGTTMPLWQFKISSLNGGGSKPTTGDITIPSDLPSGDYYVTVYADAFRDIAESREDNNINKASDQIHILSDTTPPLPPINLTATPSSWTNNNLFTIDWTNPDDPSGIAKAYYKLGSPPTSKTDGIYTTNKPFYVAATSEGGQVLYVWLMDGGDNIDHNNRSSVTLYYDATPPNNPTSCTETHGARSGVEQSNVDDPSFTWTGASDNASGIEGYYYYWGPDPNGTSSNLTTIAGFDPPKVSPGTYYLRVKTKDNAGNEATWKQLFIFIYKPVQVVLIDLTVDPGTIASNGYSSFKVVASYSDRSQKDVTSQASYKVISGPGKIENTGLQGDNKTSEDRMVIVEASYGDKTDREGITVQGKPPEPPISTYTISGRISYPSTGISIPGVTMLLSRGSSDSVLTDENGRYAFSNLQDGGSYTIKPDKTGDAYGAVTGFDAALILQYDVDLIIFEDWQLAAGDVSGNDRTTGFDAGLILQYDVGLISEFPVGKDWLFIPESRSYGSLNADQPDQNYLGVVYGDVSAGWSPPGISKAVSPLSCTLSLGGVSGTSGQRITVPVRIDNPSEIISVSLTLSYDRYRLSLADVSLTPLTEGYLLAYNDRLGEVRIALAGALPLSQGGNLLNMIFDIVRSAKEGEVSPLTVKKVLINEGAIAAEVESGVVRITEISETSKVFKLHQNFPNPFNTKTEITFVIPQDAYVTLKVFDIQGHLVATLVEGKRATGSHTVRWDAQDLASGVYFYRLKAGRLEKAKKMIILK